MKNVFLYGQSAGAFLLSSLAKDLDVDFEQQQILSKNHNAMKYLNGMMDLPCRVCLSQSAPHLSRKEAASLAEALGIDTPLLLEVGSENLRRNSSKAHCIIHANDVPESQYFEIAPEIYCPSPEYFLLQAAQSCSSAELVVAIDLVLGIFCKDQLNSSLVSRRKLSSRSSIEAFIQTCKQGKKRPDKLDRLQEALPYALENAASPKEIEAAYRLGLPPKLGGCGLGLPSLNYPLRLPHSSYYRYCDLYWPEHNVGAEYMGAKEHASVDALEADALHNNDLTELEVPRIFLTAGVLNDLGKFNKAARQIARLMGRKLSTPDADQKELQNKLKMDIRNAFIKWGF